MDANNNIPPTVKVGDFIFPVATQILKLPVISPPPPIPSSSYTTTCIEDIGETIEISLNSQKEGFKHNVPISSCSSMISSFQHDIAAYPWCLLRDITTKADYIVADVKEEVVRAAVSFSLAPGSIISTLCFGASEEVAYDATLVFTLNNGDHLSYRIDTSTTLMISNPFTYNLSHRHIVLTENQIDSECLYARHLTMMHSYSVKNWSFLTSPWRLFCQVTEKDDGVMKKENSIPHECIYIVHLVNQFIPRESQINPDSVRTPHDLYLQLQHLYKILYN